MRPIMTAEELATFKTQQHGRDYRHSDDGYGDMEVAEKAGWTIHSSWGEDGWDLGDWPYVAIYTRNTLDGYEMQQVVEGDHTIYLFASEDDRYAAIDYLFLWYAAGKQWAPLKPEERETLNIGELKVDDKFRGPYRG